MSRSTEAEVKQLIDTNLIEEQINPFLVDASLLVDAVCLNRGYGEDLLTRIECWLAAHFVAIRDPQISREKIGDVSVDYHGKSGLGLNHTPYGQQVMILDHLGCLAEVAETKTIASLRTVG